MGDRGFESSPSGGETVTNLTSSIRVDPGRMAPGWRGSALAPRRKVQRYGFAPSRGRGLKRRFDHDVLGRSRVRPLAGRGIDATTPIGCSEMALIFTAEHAVRVELRTRRRSAPPIPGGTENASILATVRGSMANWPIASTGGAARRENGGTCRYGTVPPPF